MQHQRLLSFFLLLTSNLFQFLSLSPVSYYFLDSQNDYINVDSASINEIDYLIDKNSYHLFVLCGVTSLTTIDLRAIFYQLFNITFYSNLYRGSELSEIGTKQNQVKLIFDDELAHPKCGNHICLVHYAPLIKDRSCLVSIPDSNRTEKVLKLQYKLLNSTDIINSMIDFINREANLFRKVDGSLTPLGSILDNTQLYSIPTTPTASCSIIDYNDIALNPTKFLYLYWLQQKPVIISNYPTMAKNTHRNTTNCNLDTHILQLLKENGHKKVGCKLAPSSDFEGIDSLLNWGMAGTQQVPRPILDQMQSPDLVVVRPAHREMSLSDVLRIIAENPNSLRAYVEYMPTSSLSDLVQELLPSNVLPDRLGPFLRDGKSYLWLGDGNTVGKLHFDPFDNILVQLVGEKTFRLADPSHNERFYEGHMREAELQVYGDLLWHQMPKNNPNLTYRRQPVTFRKYKLAESTSMVHSPIDLSDLNNSTERFPLAKDINFMDCVVKSGQAIFVPSFYWHEVTSSPSKPIPFDSEEDLEISYNLAVNHWFAPLYDKEFPCATCRKKLNPAYRKQLETLLNNKILLQKL